MLRVMENTKVRKKCQQKIRFPNMKRKLTDNHDESLGTNTLVKKTKLSNSDQESQSTLNSENKDISKPGFSDHHSLATALRDSWEVDSGFCSEASPPASGRSSPCLRSTMVVALDCEMVGTGPGGRCSELARCSILDYHGNILYDKYVQPCQPVTDYRTRWSGIRRHHLQNATPFTQAREEVRPTSLLVWALSNDSLSISSFPKHERSLCSILSFENSQQPLRGKVQKCEELLIKAEAVVQL